MPGCTHTCSAYSSQRSLIFRALDHALRIAAATQRLPLLLLLLLLLLRGSTATATVLGHSSSTGRLPEARAATWGVILVHLQCSGGLAVWVSFDWALPTWQREHVLEVPCW